MNRKLFPLSLTAALLLCLFLLGGQAFSGAETRVLRSELSVHSARRSCDIAGGSACRILHRPGDPQPDGLIPRFFHRSVFARIGFLIQNPFPKVSKSRTARTLSASRRSRQISCSTEMFLPQFGQIIL
jgi:hypothetical protein